MGHFGFSYVGLVYLLMLFIPNLLWAKNKPKGYTSEGENRILLFFERVGQAAVTCIVLIFLDFNIAAVGWWSSWLVLSFLLIILYEISWIRYFKNPTIETFYKSFWGIPAPLATFPLGAFLLLGVYGKVVWLIIAVIILGVGHIGIHLQHAKKTKLYL